MKEVRIQLVRSNNSDQALKTGFQKARFFQKKILPHAIKNIEVQEVEIFFEKPVASRRSEGADLAFGNAGRNFAKD
ncbi:hypothetical protein [Segetibacter koreensis]|uniref:hypothetical protein n=1 Tax=Segetibacter koreensis TaxID=398037 RepID=UPI00037CE5E0|nr:hypothetical protein [Segetibacter koreensis]